MTKVGKRGKSCDLEHFNTWVLLMTATKKMSTQWNINEQYRVANIIISFCIFVRKKNMGDISNFDIQLLKITKHK